MIRPLITFCLSLFITVPLIAQTVSSKLVDAKTQKGIPYATIQYGEHQGVISNEEGLFSFIIDERMTALDSIYISSMGYAKKGFTLEQLQDNVILLKPKAIELSGVYLFDKELTVDEIIEKVKERLPQNINKDAVKQRFFLRKAELGNIHKVDFGFERSSIKELNKELMDSIAASIPRNNHHYTESLGDLYQNNGKYKLNILKAADLYDKSEIASFEDLGSRMEAIFKENIKSDSYLKIKSGIFSQKVQVDSILSDMEEEQAETVQNELEKDTISGLLDSQRYIFKELLKELYHKEDSKLDLIEKTRKYHFELVGYADIADQGVYVIDFTPRRSSADFKGRLYINIEDFAIMRLDFENVNRLRNFRLLGITYREVLYKGTMRFAQLLNKKYELQFMDYSFGQYFAVDRPLKVVEKNKHVKGRRKQNELLLNIDFRMGHTNKWELVVFENSLIQEPQFTDYKEDKSVQATYMPRYNPEFWQGHTIMEPNQAIREFTVAEE
ncbi:carboxypeptidase-like regulatory domain-containing protein [Flagellimonas nanhaiensis]|uniref:Carboxypeptidase-like regulatory domain-containing protein n=2 Tax=Flagellimonas nanhaiensis TaxID=2292706 RepID=A0A371JSE7_9FLAO|nr:carboxypeptidase-like regulatory domain-containing protein [Allomuricauda nanhaiensis]